jgi:host factor-I protein
MSDNKWDVLEDPYLNDLRKRRLSVVIYLVNGVKQYGHIESFDRYTILLRNGTGQQILYKHTVASIMPTAKPLAQTKARPAHVVENAPARLVGAPLIIRKTPPRRIIRPGGGTGDKGHQG